MTLDTYDNLRIHIGKPMSNNDWYMLLMEEFKISKTQAKNMLHVMRRTSNAYKNASVGRN